MPHGKRWIGFMLIGIGLMLFGVSRQHWQEWSGLAVLAAGIVLVLRERVYGASRTLMGPVVLYGSLYCKGKRADETHNSIRKLKRQR